MLTIFYKNKENDAKASEVLTSNNNNIYDPQNRVNFRNEMRSDFTPDKYSIVSFYSSSCSATRVEDIASKMIKEFDSKNKVQKIFVEVIFGLNEVTLDELGVIDNTICAVFGNNIEIILGIFENDKLENDLECYCFFEKRKVKITPC